MSIDYREPLTPVHGASGSGIYKDGDLTIDIADGAVGNMAIGKGRVLLKNIAHATQGSALVNLTLDGSLRDVFDYVSLAPISLDTKTLGFDSGKAIGKAALDISLAFPTTKHVSADEVAVKVDGTLTNVSVPGAVEGLDLAGGPFHLTVADGAAGLEGKGTIDGRPIAFAWQQYLHSADKPFSSRVKASLIADGALRDHFGAGLHSLIDGAFPVDILYTVMPDKRASVSVSADLTPGKLTLSPVRYVKDPGKRGSVRCDVKLAAGKVQSIENLHLETDVLNLDKGTLLFGELKGLHTVRSGTLPAIRLNESKLQAKFAVQEDGRIVLSGSGPFLDATPFLTRKPDQNEEIGPALTADIRVDAMRTSPEGIVSDVRFTMERSAGGIFDRLNLQAIAGKGPVTLSLQPQDGGGKALSLKAADAGAMLKAFDIYKNAVGGALSVKGKSSAEAPRSIKGTAQIADFRVVGAPILARIMNAASFSGIQQLVGGGGMRFSMLQSDFGWEMDPHGDIYTVSKGRTSGASLGLTFDGKVDKRTNRIDIRGTIVPISTLNGFIGTIPLVGTILTGGGALFAFTYHVSGPADDPSVFVNPLSALAPGVLRQLLFE